MPRFPPRYQICDLLGQGTQAEIRRCVDRETGEEFAVKLIYYGNLSTGSKEYYGVAREGYLMQAFKHPHILPVYEVYIDSQLQTIYLVMRLMSRALKDVIATFRRKRTPMPEDSIWRYAFQILDALLYLHSHRTTAYYRSVAAGDSRVAFPIPHRDLKPDNILLDEEDKVFLADFSLAAQFEHEDLKKLKNIDSDVGFAGARGYRAPEAFCGVAGVENDIWALGCIVYEMATGEPLFPTPESQSSYFLGKKRFRIDLPGRSPELSAFVDAILTFSTTQRPTAMQLLRHPRFRDWLSPSIKEEITLSQDAVRQVIQLATTANELDQVLRSLSWSGTVDLTALQSLLEYLKADRCPVELPRNHSSGLQEDGLTVLPIKPPLGYDGHISLTQNLDEAFFSLPKGVIRDTGRSPQSRFQKLRQAGIFEEVEEPTPESPSTNQDQNRLEAELAPEYASIRHSSVATNCMERLHRLRRLSNCSTSPLRTRPDMRSP